jgi:hypothetical protein
MNKEFAVRLEEYLGSELCDYGLSYSWEWVQDCNWCTVKVKKDIEPVKECEINFRFVLGDLMIELTEDSWYTTREYDQTVKYLWMLVGRLFG